MATQTASRQEIQLLVHLLFPQALLGTVCLQQDSNHVCLWPGNHLHHDTTKHGYSVVKESTREWNGALLSSVMRVRSVCMPVMDVLNIRRRPGKHNLRQCIHPQHTGPISGFMMWGPSVTACGHIFFVSAG